MLIAGSDIPTVGGRESRERLADKGSFQSLELLRRGRGALLGRAAWGSLSLAGSGRGSGALGGGEIGSGEEGDR